MNVMDELRFATDKVVVSTLEKRVRIGTRRSIYQCHCYYEDDNDDVATLLVRPQNEISNVIVACFRRTVAIIETSKAFKAI
jgi:hypothetical protein